MSLPPDIAPPPAETPEERFARRIATADLLRRRRLCAGLTLKQVALASMMDTSRISRYEMKSQYPGPVAAERVLTAIARLESEGAGNAARAAEARSEYETEEAEAAGSAR